MSYIHYDEPKGERVLRDIDAVLLARHGLRLAILATIEEGLNGIPWGAGFYHPFGAVREEARERFCEAVIQRVGKQ